MIEDNLITRICVRIFAWIYSFAIPIVSFIYYIYYVTQRKSLLVEWLPGTFSTEFLNSSLSGFLHYWLGFELIFLLYFQVTKSRFQSHLPPVVPSKQIRHELHNFFFCTIDKFENWLEGWFNVGHKRSTFNQIYRDNFAEWISWSFFSTSLENIRNHPEYSKEMYEMIESIEKRRNVKFHQGYNPNCECIKLTLDPVEAIPRPFVFYATIFLLSSAFNILLKLYGFEHFGSKESILNGYWSSTLEFDIQEGSPPSRISYWYYDPHSCCDSFPLKKKKERQKPIVFIHGVGGGLFCYFNFIKRLWKLDRPLFLVELPYVSMQMVEDVPTMEETVREIEEMLISRNYPKAIFVAHSLGTAVCAWMIKEARKRISAEKDNIVPSKEVYKYLSKNTVNVHMMRKLDHASFLFNTHWEDRIISSVLKCCNSRRS
ncbi:5858_t:CDS:2 [Dentiscutata heterogama]|uniref:5858_t:CDS:1 n=1 Tax=Dentiscutata heterogama TaxID=1316150 RepID=A0ACA9MRG1_9GLOM|nr:5858_t:CDS:2 [Dentiscutata heterogama]